MWRWGRPAARAATGSSRMTARPNSAMWSRSMPCRTIKWRTEMHLKTKLALGAVLLAFAAGNADAATATRAPFGQLADGTKVEAVTLTNGHGISAKIMTLGATLQSLMVPDKAGHAQDITLDGKTYTLATNDGPNSLHGGLKGFDKRMWKIDSVSSGPDAKVVLSYVSADGEEGFPGQLKVTATYSLNEQNELRLDYRATTSKPTVLNLTNHSYFNLSGSDARDVMDDMVTLHAERF